LSGVTQQDKKPNRLSRILADAWRSRQSLSEHVASGGAEEGGIETGRLSAAARVSSFRAAPYTTIPKQTGSTSYQQDFRLATLVRLLVKTDI
jgi:hypothetical protein